MADPAPPRHDSVDFEETTDGTYAEMFAASCAPPVSTRTGYVLTGVCPRCHGEMTFPVVETVFRSTVTADAAVADDASDVPMLCRCPLPHHRRPVGDEGCGAYWNIRLADDAAS